MRDGPGPAGAKAAPPPSGSPSRQLSRGPSSRGRPNDAAGSASPEAAPGGAKDKDKDKDGTSMLERRLRGARERVERIRTEAAHHPHPPPHQEADHDAADPAPPPARDGEQRGFEFGTGDFGEVGRLLCAQAPQPPSPKTPSACTCCNLSDGPVLRRSLCAVLYVTKSVTL